MIKMFFVFCFCFFPGEMGASTDKKSEYSVDTVPAVCTSNLIKVELHKVHFKCKEAERVVNLVKAIPHIHAAAAAESIVKMHHCIR